MEYIYAFFNDDLINIINNFFKIDEIDEINENSFEIIPIIYICNDIIYGLNYII